MHYYFSRKRTAGTVHIINNKWSLCNRTGPWPKGLFWWVVKGYPVCKLCRRELKNVIRERRNFAQAKARRERKGHG